MQTITKKCYEDLKRNISLVSLIDPWLEMFPHYDKEKVKFVLINCPFHEDHNMQFIVNPKTNTYFCTECDAHGDGIEYLMNVKKMGFMESVKYLSEKFCVELEFTECFPSEKEQEIAKTFMKLFT
jgi:DNA primase